MSFRVAIGQCDCAKPRNAIVAALCTKVRDKIEHLRRLSHGQLAQLIDDSEETWIEGKRGDITVHRVPGEGDTMMIVVQGFVSTFRWPTYVGTNGVGHVVAEGFLIDSQGIQPAPDDALWEFR